MRLKNGWPSTMPYSRASNPSAAGKGALSGWSRLFLGVQACPLCSGDISVKAGGAGDGLSQSPGSGSKITVGM